MAFGTTYQSDDREGGFKILKPQAYQTGFRIRKPQKEHPTIFRPGPAFVGNEILPVRRDGVFTDWICSLKTFNGGLDGAFTSFICALPAGGGRIQPPTVEGPVDILFKRMELLEKNKSEAHGDEGTPHVRWFRLLEGATGKGAALTKPQMCGYMQGIVYAHGGVDFSQIWQKDGVRSVMMLPKSGRQSIENLLNAEVENYQSFGISKESDQRFQVGTWMTTVPDVNGQLHVKPMFIKFVERARDSSKPGGSGKSSFGAYAVDLMEDWPLPAEFLRSLWKPWEEILEIFDPEQQCYMLRQAGFTSEMLRFALGDQTYLPQSIRTERIINVPPMGHGQGAGPVPGQPVYPAQPTTAAPAYPTQPSYGGVPPIYPPGTTPSFAPPAPAAPVYVPPAPAAPVYVPPAPAASPPAGFGQPSAPPPPSWGGQPSQPTQQPVQPPQAGWGGQPMQQPVQPHQAGYGPPPQTGYVPPSAPPAPGGYVAPVPMQPPAASGYAAPPMAQPPAMSGYMAPAPIQPPTVSAPVGGYGPPMAGSPVSPAPAFNMQGMVPPTNPAAAPGVNPTGDPNATPNAAAELAKMQARIAQMSGGQPQVGPPPVAPPPGGAAPY